jgi:hypothetical protein
MKPMWMKGKLSETGPAADQGDPHWPDRRAQSALSRGMAPSRFQKQGWGQVKLPK